MNTLNDKNVDEILCEVPFVCRFGQRLYSAVGFLEFLRESELFVIKDIEICPLYIFDNSCGDFYWYKMTITESMTFDEYVVKRTKREIDQIGKFELELCKKLFVNTKSSSPIVVKDAIINYLNSLITDVDIKKDIELRWGVYDSSNFYLEIY